MIPWKRSQRAAFIGYFLSPCFWRFATSSVLVSASWISVSSPPSKLFPPALPVYGLNHSPFVERVRGNEAFVLQRHRCRRRLSMVEPFEDPKAKKRRRQQEGTEIITNAAVEAGVQEDDIVSIEWKSGKVVVTVDIPVGEESDIDEEALYDEDEALQMDYKGDGVDDELYMGEFEEESFTTDVTTIARAINSAFEDQGEGSIGWDIATRYEIEVTTPGFDGVLTDSRMFQAYRGFDVICEYSDSKAKKTKFVEGKLVERNDDVTIINVKGRIRKLKNGNVERVRLPKAKKEKGVR